MSCFPIKKFQGQVYTFAHLNGETREINYEIDGIAKKIIIDVTFGWHCFTETFDSNIHNQEHVYKHKDHIRAFNLERYECSQHLPSSLDRLMNGLVYRSNQNFTYVLQIQISTSKGNVPYSIFFSLSNIRKSNKLHSNKIVLDLYVKSAYLTHLKSGKNAQNARFRKIAGETAGFF